MSISKAARGARSPAKSAKSGTAKRDRAGSAALLLTVSQPGLLEHGSDQRFRAMVYDLLTITTRMEQVRAHHGRRMGITGPQYSVVIAIAHLQGSDGVSVGTVAQTLHVSSAFIAMETGKLARRGLVVKHTNQRDRRGVLLSLTPAGRLKLGRVSGEIQAVNDLFFGLLDAKSFAALCAAATRLVDGSRKAMHYLAAIEDAPPAARFSTGGVSS
jgi:DNA-binding MarR family transcriptional regulator